MTRRFLAGALTAIAVALTASPALAHQGNPNYRSELDGIQPAIPGLDVQVLNYDDSLQVQNETGKTVTVDGYEHEPYVRIAADGSVEVNHSSPAYYLNDDRYGNAQVPEGVSADSPPDWQPVDGTGQYVWHDHRVHYMGTELPNQVTDESKRTKIFDYRVPIQVGAERAAITGTLYWVGEENGFPVLPFVALAALVLVGIAIVIRRRRRSPSAAPGAEPPTEEAW